MNPFTTLTFSLFNPPGVTFNILHDATIWGPWTGTYWLLHNLTLWSSSGNSTAFSFWLIEPGALTALKQQIALTGDYLPNYTSTLSTAAPPIAGIHKIGACDGQPNIGDWTNMLAQGPAGTPGTGMMTNSWGQRRIVIPSGYSIYCVRQGADIPNATLFMQFAYQVYNNGCRPDTFGYRLPFRGANYNDFSGMTSPISSA